MKLTFDEFEDTDVVMVAAHYDDDEDYQDHDMSPIGDLEYDC